ncbi:MAG: hypothetical protein U0T36_02830 [Saprospiraceae bacterium]
MLSKALIFIILFTSCASIKKQSNYTEEIADHRTTYKKGFLEDPRSPLTADDLKNLDFYPPDPEWKLSCMCIKADGAKPFELPTYSGITRTYIVHSKVKCLYKDKVLEFNLYKNLTQPANPLYKKNYLFSSIQRRDQQYGHLWRRQVHQSVRNQHSKWKNSHRFQQMLQPLVRL